MGPGKRIKKVETCWWNLILTVLRSDRAFIINVIFFIFIYLFLFFRWERENQSRSGKTTVESRPEISLQRNDGIIVRCVYIDSLIYTVDVACITVIGLLRLDTSSWQFKWDRDNEKKKNSGLSNNFGSLYDRMQYSLSKLFFSVQHERKSIVTWSQHDCRAVSRYFVVTQRQYYRPMCIYSWTVIYVQRT